LHSVASRNGVVVDPPIIALHIAAAARIPAEGNEILGSAVLPVCDMDFGGSLVDLSGLKFLRDLYFFDGDEGVKVGW